MSNGQPKAKRNRRGPKSLTDEQARAEAIRQHFEGRELRRIACSVMRPAVIIRGWLEDITLKDFALKRRLDIMMIIAVSDQVAVSSTRSADGEGDTSKRRELMAAAKYASENAARTWKQLEQLEELTRATRPPKVVSKPKLVA